VPNADPVPGDEARGLSAFGSFSTLRFRSPVTC
jgi:hypothetical protein